MTGANEEITRLTAKNLELTEKNEKLSLLVVKVDDLKQEVEYLKNKVSCAKKIESSLIDQLKENKIKVRA